DGFGERLDAADLAAERRLAAGVELLTGGQGRLVSLGKEDLAERLLPLLLAERVAELHPVDGPFWRGELETLGPPPVALGHRLFALVNGFFEARDDLVAGAKQLGNQVALEPAGRVGIDEGDGNKKLLAGGLQAGGGFEPRLVRLRLGPAGAEQQQPDNEGPES